MTSRMTSRARVTSSRARDVARDIPDSEQIGIEVLSMPNFENRTIIKGDTAIFVKACQIPKQKQKKLFFYLLNFVRVFHLTKI